MIKTLKQPLTQDQVSWPQHGPSYHQTAKTKQGGTRRETGPFLIFFSHLPGKYWHRKYSL